MRKRMCLLLAALATGMTAFADIPQKTYNHNITKAKPIAYGKYIVQDEDSISVLNTKASTDKFQDESGRVVSSKKHSNIMWKIPDPASANNNETLVRAKSPLIPGKKGSYVFVKGAFKAEAKGRGGKAVSKSAAGPQWSSLLKEPGVHVILVHLYSFEDAAWAQVLNSSANALKREYEGPGDRCLIITVGPGKNITSIAGLPDYLKAQDVKKGTVITLDTLGHGYHTSDAGFDFIFLKSARSKDCDYVGREEDFDAPVNNFEPQMTTPTFCGFFKDFLKKDAFIGLYHCWSAESYKVPPPPNTTAPSILAQVLASLGPDRQACGLHGVVRFAAGSRPCPLAPGYFLFGTATRGNK